MKKILDLVGGILAFFVVGMFGLVLINQQFSFLPTSFLTFFNGIKDMAVIAVCGITGLEFAWKRNFILKWAFIALLVVCVAFFFPALF